MRRLLRNIVFTVLRYSGIPFVLREVVQRDKVTIVVFHAPSATRATAYFQSLRTHYNVIALADYVRARSNGAARKLPPKSLIITIDDGHRSNFELKSLLERLRIPITIFLCSGVVGTNRHYWWFHTRPDGEAQACKRMLDAERLRFLLTRDYRPDQEYPDRQALSDGEIEELRAWVDFQSHTVSHPILPRCPGELAEREIVQSKTDLEGRYGFKVQALAFPNGDYSEREIHLARSAGYKCALTLEPGSNDQNTDLFLLRRIPLQDDASESELLVKTSGLWGHFRLARSLSRSLAGRSGFGRAERVVGYEMAKVNLRQGPPA
jgi:peptidoglycan/xylan/chitin deacetylase (PgdA/CDA1 family)